MASDGVPVDVLPLYQIDIPVRHEAEDGQATYTHQSYKVHAPTQGEAKSLLIKHLKAGRLPNGTRITELSPGRIPAAVVLPA